MLKASLFNKRFLLLRVFLVLSTLGCSSQHNSNDEVPLLLASESTESSLVVGQLSAKNSTAILKTRWKFRVSGILLHHTRGLSLEEYMHQASSGGWMVHYAVDKDGKVYAVEDPGGTELKAAPILDPYMLHIVWEGNKEEILKRPVQRKSLVQLVGNLSNQFKIPFTNYDIASKAGIFTHTQAKKKYGRFVDTSDCGMENVLKAILEDLSGKYYPELEWKNRFGPDWVLRKERPFSGPKGEEIEPTYDRGRGTTKTSKIDLESIEKTPDGVQPEDRRLKYNYRGVISADCIVLHFTAIPDYFHTMKVLEKRNLSATFLADKDGKVYQLLDHPLHMAAAATGTNRNCFQVEIVGKDTEMLLSNQKQAEGVAKLVKELSLKYEIPLNNQKIESLNGIYSHTQAKKKWGGSIFLDGKDFDPGEPYMKKIIELVSGTFYEEQDWYDRLGPDWILLFSEFQP
ncbi:N-acetylmuramoyl-L-alanine amidase [Leptospira perolatii]|uniref:N-acetylmuramoyl-L-alanine amidase n=1 Tax=Leptospira perolatii TaxID=2023191 RepID=A0A2M9ZJN0_9LEPT|nr:N-acetylmuramoyl-L-alanine amidase [Leptospira perolatii]PJZ68873.1 N-acetylmuramoyl-L-alanine amidase [Leptospira perolatii]PJZ72204.1 N-acetylmuramoyl-L-alanine amidase [Leptospira perolatii]